MLKDLEEKFKLYCESESLEVNQNQIQVIKKLQNYFNKNLYVSILYASFAIKKLYELKPLIGANSFISAPITFAFLKVVLIKLNVSYQNKPPGSGVPVAGIILESKPSTSKVR